MQGGVSAKHNQSAVKLKISHQIKWKVIMSIGLALSALSLVLVTYHIISSRPTSVTHTTTTDSRIEVVTTTTNRSTEATTTNEDTTEVATHNMFPPDMPDGARADDTVYEED